MKILAIDDNQDNLTAMRAVVSDKLPKVKIFTALSGAKGLELAQIEDPDVILLDIVMPGMDGYETCRRIKADEHLQAIPVIFLTALKTDRDSRIKALEAGAEGFLSKPFDDVELCVQIQAMAKIKAATLLQRTDKERLANLVVERTRALQQSQISMLNVLEDLHAENAARKKSEQLLRESEVELVGILETTADGILAVDNHGKIIKTNQRFADMWLIPKAVMESGEDQELLNHVMSQLVDPESFIETVRTLYNSKQESMDTLVFRDGRIFERHSSPLVLEGELLGRVWSFRNITSHKQAENALSQQLDELRRWQTATLGRENRIGELKREVNALAGRLGLALPYATPDSP